MPRRHTIRGQIRRGQDEEGSAAAAEGEYFEVDPGQLAGVFAAPKWLRNLGLMSWLLVGVAGVLVGLVWLMSLTHTIVLPVLSAAIIAAVLSPTVRALERVRVPRAVAALLLMLAVVLAGVALGVLILNGISSEANSIQRALQSAVEKAEGWLNDLGVSRDGARKAGDNASSATGAGFHALVDGLKTGIDALGSLVIFASFTVLSLFFLLKDGPAIRGWAESHLGLPVPLARSITHRVIQSLRGYFIGVTAVALFNAVVIGGGALVLGVPLAGTIAVVNFVGAFIPYLGAWTAGAFTVLIALGNSGTDVAIAMAVICLLANGILQQMIQPIAYGAALGIHPLAVLVVTIAGGCLFGTIGLVLAAPLTAAATKISTDVARARAAEEDDADDEEADGPEPAPASA